MNLYDLQVEVEKRLNKKRFHHTLGVQTTSFALALLYGEDYNKASYAGLLHDNAKDMTDYELLSKCKELNIPVRPIEEKSPHLLHGKVGAGLAKTDFNVRDQDILNAIAYHTTGRPGMSLLEKIVFVADYIEPNRSLARNKSLDKIRRLAFSDINLALIEILESTIKYLSDDTSKIDSLTIDTYNYYTKWYIDYRLEGNKWLTLRKWLKMLIRR